MSITATSDSIARRTGCPDDVDQWEWGCGFSPGSGPGEGSSGHRRDVARSQLGFCLAAVPELTGSHAIKLNAQVSLRCNRKRVVIYHRTISPSGPTMAKPSVDHIPARGLFLNRVSEWFACPSFQIICVRCEAIDLQFLD
jgi:hypothetical protein